MDNWGPLLKGMAAGTLILLGTFKPRDGWGPRALLALASRFAAGLGFSLVGTEFATMVYPDVPQALAAALLMAYGLQIGVHVEKWINKAGKKAHGQPDTDAAPLGPPEVK